MPWKALLQLFLVLFVLLPAALLAEPQALAPSGAPLTPPDPRFLSALDKKYKVTEYREDQQFTAELIRLTNQIQLADKNKDNKKLRELYQKQIKAFPDFGRAYVLYTSFLLRQGDLQEAEQIAAQGLEQAPSYPELLMFKDSFPEIKEAKERKVQEEKIEKLLENFSGAAWIRQQHLVQNMLQAQKAR